MNNTIYISNIEEYFNIVKYLEYLRDISVKLSGVRELSRIFSRTSARYICCDDTISEHAKLSFVNRYRPYLGSSQRIFQGQGFLYGKKDNVKICEPIVYKEYENQENKIIINYDLISRIIPSPTIEEEIPKFPIGDLIETIEKNIKNTDNLLVVVSKVIESIQSFCKIYEIPVTIKEKKLDIDENGKIIFQDRELNSNENIFYVDKQKVSLFVANIPHELSISNSISLLIEELRQKKSLDNKLVEKLSKSIFSEDPQHIDMEEDKKEEYERHIEKFLPIPLSENQKKAIVNAFCSEISYVQGPPGTGKSHTIIAIALLGIIKRKKVLIVSHKEPAVRVINDKLKNYIDPNFQNANILPYIYITEEAKQKLKEEIQKILDFSHNTSLLKEIIAKMHQEWEKSNQELNKRLLYIEEEEKKKQEILNKMTKHYELHKEIEKLESDFFQRYYKKSKSDSINTQNKFIVHNLPKIKKLCSYLKRIEIPKLSKYKAIFYLVCLKEISKLAPWYIDLKKIENKFELTKLVEYVINILSHKKQFEDLHKEMEKNNLHSHLKVIRNIIDYEKKHYLPQYRSNIINIANQGNIARSLLQKETRENLSSFLKTITSKSYTTKKKLIEKIDYNHLTNVFPIWISEIDNVNELIMMRPNIFDLVVIDEASQVNLAEILPVIYRAKRLCIVGDHKQLSLVSTGLNLRISSKLDEIIWSKYKPGNLTYQQAEKKKIILTKASILDLIISDNKEEGINLGYIPRVILDQHFRSLPLLFKFNNTKFYDNKLIIMTETPPNWKIRPFKAIKIHGKRKGDKTIPAEADIVIQIVKSLISNRTYEDVDLSNILPPRFNIGIISPIREQAYLITEKLFIQLDEKERGRYEIIVGTPEELQGHERDVIIISFCTDSESLRSKAHYENPNRFNVMTSRARFFTFFVFSEMPGNFILTREYLRFMGYELENQNTIQVDLPWKFDEKKLESEFEKIVYHYLLQYKSNRKSVEIYNQVESCGKRLDFVVYNPLNKRFIAIEVDGKQHFEKDGITPTKYHQERIEILKTAGWKIINTPYYRWFDHTGKLKDNKEIEEVIGKLYTELDKELGIAT